MNLDTSPQATDGWLFFDRDDFHPAMRRRKLVGRRVVDVDQAEREVRSQLRISYEEFVERTASALAWLCQTSNYSSFSLQPWEAQTACTYLVPLSDKPLRFHRWDRYFDQTISPDGAGLCATEFAVSRLANERWDDPRFIFNDGPLTTFAKRLATYREHHPEYFKVARVLD